MLSNTVREIMSSELITAPASSTVQEIMTTLVAADADAVLLTENGLPTGIFTERHVLRYVVNNPTDNRTTPVAAIMTSPIRAVSDDTPIVEALGEMLQRRIRHLLVRAPQTKKVVGIISMRRILRMVVEIGHGLNETRTVGDIMAADPLSVDQTALVYDAVALMNQRDTGAAVVRSGAAPIGIVTERDVLRRVVMAEKEPQHTMIGDVMSAPLISMPRTALVGQVLDLMHARKFRNMPVCDEGKLVGLVSMPEIIQYARALDIDDAVRRSWQEVQEFYDSLDIYTPG